MRRIVYGPTADVQELSNRVDALAGCPITPVSSVTGLPDTKAQKTLTMGRVYTHKSDPTLSAYVVRAGRNLAFARAVKQAILDKPLAQRTARERSMLQNLSVESDWSDVWAEVNP